MNTTPSQIADRSGLPFATVGPYTLLSKIGSGGMGSVYLARHAHLERLVALKTLTPRGQGSPAAVQRFRQEMKAVGRLKHPNIINATDAGSDGGRHYLVMDYVAGADLGRLLRERGPFAVPDACELARQAAEALACIERNGLVHRDVKPSNLLLGSDGVLRLLDLGLARLREPAQGQEELTEPGQVMGTGDFIAPEQGLSSHHVDVRADVYSLGCTLYALLAGKPPFSGPPFVNLYLKLQAHQHEPVPPILATRPDLPAGLSDLLERMLKKDPAQRIGSPAQVASELTPFTAGHRLEQLTSSPDAEADSALNSSRPPSETVVQEKRPHPQAVAHGQALPPRRGRRWWMASALGLTLVAALAVGLALHLRGKATDSGPDPTGDFAPVRKPGVWYDLLEERPRVLRWPGGDPSAHWHHEAKKRELWANVSGMALFELGSVESPGFDLEVTVYQSFWAGGFGFFFRGRDEPLDFGHKFLTDVILFERVTQADKLTEVRVLRGQIHANLETGRCLREFPEVALMPRPQGREQRFVFSVHSRGPKSITCEGKPIATSLCGVVKTIPPREGASGKVGLLIEDCALSLRSVRLRTHVRGDGP